MSRLGKTPIPLPLGVEVNIEGATLSVKGEKGYLTFPLVRGISLQVNEGFIFVKRDEAVELPKTTHGLYRAQLNNMIIGVSKGFEKRLTLIGVGYRASVQGSYVDLQIGRSHSTQIAIPEGVKVAVDKNVSILITGIDKQVVGQFAAALRGEKPPEPYKGKGIRYEKESVRKKAGKAAKSKTSGA